MSGNSDSEPQSDLSEGEQKPKKAKRVGKCKTCGVVFDPPGRHGRIPKWCSAECRPRVIYPSQVYKRKRAGPVVLSASLEDRPLCGHCACERVPITERWGIFCSEKCQENARLWDVQGGVCSCGKPWAGDAICPDCGFQHAAAFGIY